MNKRIVFLSLLFFSAQLTAIAQRCKTDFSGTKTLYKAPAKHPDAVPAGYQPVFINYVGRHGARHLTKAPESASVYKLVSKADSAQALTTEGQRLKGMLTALQQVEKGNTKSISVEGKEELKGIAGRMYTNNQNVFAAHPRLRVSITKEVRTKQSAEAFLSGLPRLPDANIEQEGINDTALRFYDLSPAYLQFEKNGSWISGMTALKTQLNLKAVNRTITTRFFKPDFLIRLSSESQEGFANDIFGFATIVYSLQAEIEKAGFKPSDLNFESFFTCDELKVLSKTDAAEDFLKKGPGTNAMGIQVKIAAPLLADFIKTTDAFLRDGTVNAQLRFAHAETISPFATLLGLTAASRATSNILQFDTAWQAKNIIPLSANIQWILYKNSTGNLLVKVLLNEKPSQINGLKPLYGYYYNWADIRKLYTAKLQTAGTSINSDMKAFLKTVQ